MQKYLTSGQMSRKLRISISTLKRWLEDDSGLGILDRRNQNGWRLFSHSDVERLIEYKRELKRSGKRFADTTLIPIVVNGNTFKGVA